MGQNWAGIGAVQARCEVITGNVLWIAWWQTAWNFIHDDVIKWKHFPCYWPFVWGIHRSPVDSLHKGQWPGALMFSLICACINGWVNNREAGDLRRHEDVHESRVYTMHMYEECMYCCHWLSPSIHPSIHFIPVAFSCMKKAQAINFQNDTKLLKT